MSWRLGLGQRDNVTAKCQSGTGCVRSLVLDGLYYYSIKEQCSGWWLYM